MIPRIRIHERHVLMWLLGVTMATIAVGALWLGLNHHEEHKLAPGGSAQVRWMRPGQQSIIADYFDPSVMSLPNPRGFSAAAWRHFAPASQALYVTDRAPAYLPQPPAAPLAVLLPEPALDQLAQTEIVPTIIVTEPDSIEVIHAGTNSVIELTGALIRRRLVQVPVLPLASPAARTTRVLVAVTGAGRVRYAAVERSSGNEQLDGAAVAAVRQVWFAPEPNVDPLSETWGTVRLLWAERI